MQNRTNHALPYAAPARMTEARALRKQLIEKAMEEPYTRSSVYGHTTREGHRKAEYKALKAMYERDKKKEG